MLPEPILILLGKREVEPNSFDGGPTRRGQQATHTLLAIIAVLLAGWALKAMSPVMVPLALAVFFVAVFWPLHWRLQGRVGRKLATLAVAAAFLLLFLVFGLALWFSVEVVANLWPEYADRFTRYQQQLQVLLEQFRLADSGQQAGQAELERASQVFFDAGTRLLGAAAGFTLVLAFLVFGLWEALEFKERFRRIVPDADLDSWLAVVHRVTADFQRYILVRTLVGLISGALVWLFSLVIGLDLAFVWGLTNFLLNYIPTVGSVLAVIPPVVFGLVQYESVAMAASVLLGVGGAQLIMGQYVDPWLQGKYLSLSPLVVLISVVFWGWLWGIVGAFISVPLTILVVIACEQFERTRWIAVMLAEVGRAGNAVDAD